MAQGSLADDVAQLDELEILVVVDNETDTLSSVDDGVPQIPEIIHLAAHRTRRSVAARPAPSRDRRRLSALPPVAPRRPRDP